MSGDRAHPLRYLAIAFALTWTGWGLTAWLAHLGYPPQWEWAYRILNALAGYSPLIASLFLLRRSLLSGRFWADFLLGARRHPLRYGAAGLLFALSLAVYLLFGDASQVTPGLLASTFLTQCLFGGGMEEFGWRGYLQPALQRRISAVIAAVAVGVVWSLWHLPLWVLPGTYQEGTSVLLYTVHAVITSLSLAAVLKLTGSVGLCVLYHGWTNALFMLFPLEMSPAYWALHILEGLLAAGACVWADSCRKSSA